MKAARLALTVLAVMLLVSVSADAQESITDVVQKVKPAVVTVITYDKDGKEEGFGTGFFVTDSHIITNYHVIEGAARAEVKSATGKVYKVKGVAGSDEIADVARLVLEQPVEDAPVLTLSKSVPKEGERIVVVGSPLGLELTVTDGIVSAVRDMPGMGKFIQLTAAISPGSSGSPVVNLKGEVVGVATSYLTEGQSLNFAVSAKHVAKLKSTTVTAIGKVTSQTSDKARDDVRKGIDYFLRGEHAKALPHLEAATKAYTRNSLVWFALGHTYGKLGHHTEEIAAFKEAIRIDPDDALAHSSLGYCYGELGRDTEAIAAFKEAIRIDPDFADAHVSLGMTYGILGRYTEAIASYKEAIRLDPDFALTHFVLGVAYGELGRHTEAIDACKKAIRLNPNFALAHRNLGANYLELGRYTEAIASYKEAIRLDPDLSSAHHNLGVAYGQVGRYTEAIAACKQAIRIDPDNAGTHVLLGITYLLIDNRSGALDQYKILKGLDAEMAKKLFDLIYP